jgi:hypothetical protein
LSGQRVVGAAGVELRLGAQLQQLEAQPASSLVAQQLAGPGEQRQGALGGARLAHLVEAAHRHRVLVGLLADRRGRVGAGARWRGGSFVFGGGRRLHGGVERLVARHPRRGEIDMNGGLWSRLAERLGLGDPRRDVLLGGGAVEAQLAGGADQRRPGEQLGLEIARGGGGGMGGEQPVLTAGPPRAGGRRRLVEPNERQARLDQLPPGGDVRVVGDRRACDWREQRLGELWLVLDRKSVV